VAFPKNWQKGQEYPGGWVSGGSKNIKKGSIGKSNSARRKEATERPARRGGLGRKKKFPVYWPRWAEDDGKKKKRTLVTGEGKKGRTKILAIVVTVGICEKHLFKESGEKTATLLTLMTLSGSILNMGGRVVFRLVKNGLANPDPRKKGGHQIPGGHTASKMRRPWVKE